MANQAYEYVIVGGGLAGGSAVEGIRSRDKNGGIALIGAEAHLPYHRPPLSKQLWFGKKQVDEIFLHDRAFYDKNGVTVRLDRRVTSIDIGAKRIATSTGETYEYGKLLLATGGVPRRLAVPGGDLDGLVHFRTLDDYRRLRELSAAGKSAVVIGGGFIGSEIAAALAINKIDVTMIFPDPYLVSRVFPADLGRFLTERYRARGIRIMANDKPVAFQKHGEKFSTTTASGKVIASDLLIVGIGIAPSVELGKGAGLEIANGIVVNEDLETSNPAVYAAGDNAFFPYSALGKRMRIEHWDNALHQGRCAGRNMAGAKEPFTYLPYFFSDLFDFGYEAVGDVDAELETFADWKREYDTGVVYYLKDGKVRGAMMCNVWDRTDAARELIRRGTRATPDSLRGAI